MNVFVLTAGRSGSLTFAEACRHITNFSAGHETRVGLVGDARLAYPEGHIEVDPRLAWFLGRMEAAYGDQAFYVHLRRDEMAVAASYAKRWSTPGVRSYRQGILWDVDPDVDRMRLTLDYVRTLTSNIEYYLRDKTRTMRIDIDDAADSFPDFWDAIGAQGDLDAALAELSVKHHEGRSARKTPRPNRPERPAKRRRKGGGSRLARLLRRR